jgi:hypothetical protein
MLNTFLTSKRLRHAGKYAHAIAVSLLAGAALSLLDAGAVFEGLVWRYMGPVLLAKSDVRTSSANEKSALAILVGNRYFIDTFGERTPLDRGELARIVDTTARALPYSGNSVVAIDFDLSPLAKPTKNGREGADEIEDQLRLDKSLLLLAERARVVLLCPLKLSTGLDEVALKWSDALFRQTTELRRKGKGIEFAFAELDIRHGAVIDYDPRSYSLGVRAGLVRSALQTPIVVGKAAIPAPRHCMPRNQTDQNSDGEAQQRHKLFPASIARVSRIEVNASAEIAQVLRAFAQSPNLPLIFIGGMYSNHGDEFRVITNEIVPGAAIHAAIALSAEPPSTASERFHSALAEVLVELVAVIALFLVAGWGLSDLICRLVVPNNKSPSVPYPRAAASFGTFLWAFYPSTADKSPTEEIYSIESWARWTASIAILVTAFLFIMFVIAYLMVSLGVWFDFVLAAFAAWVQVVASIVKTIQGKLAESNSQSADNASRRTSASFVWVAIGLQLTVVGIGVIYIAITIWQMF